MFEKIVGTRMTLAAAEFFTQYNQTDVLKENAQLKVKPSELPGRFDVVFCKDTNPLDLTTINRLRSESGAVNEAYARGVSDGFDAGLDRMAEAWKNSIKATSNIG